MENKIAIIKNGIIDNVIVASDEFAKSLQEETVNITGLEEVSVGWNYKNGEFTDENGLTIEEKKASDNLRWERQWRDVELSMTDFIVPLTDHPKHSAYIIYRQELRDYPSQPDFRNGTRPIKP